MRCSDCTRFVSHEFNEPDDFNLEVGESEIEGEVHLALTCQECGSELATLDETFTLEYPQEALDHFSQYEEDTEHGPDTIEDESWSMGDYYRARRNPGTYKTGPKAGQPKPVPFRFQTHYYTVSLSATVACKCGARFDIEETEVVEAAASDFEQVY